MSTPATRPVPVRFSIERSDRHRGLTYAAVLGASAGVALMTLGLPPVDLHPPWHFVGIMDPLCGGTRSARLTMLGHFREAWRYNPLGIAAVLAALIVTGRGAVGVVTGRWPDVHLHLPVVAIRGLWLLAAVATAALWVRQQQLADLLMRTG